ncbi:MAG: aspartyl protease family protein [Verrucomicrobiota bacterium]|nr:aspartyl protease family protein [Verrucomicrobiota bacterium]
MKRFHRTKSIRGAVIGIVGCLGGAAASCDGSVALNSLGQFLAGRGYGGAQLVHPGNFFRVPINSNGKAGDLLIDTGSPTSLIFRGSVRKLVLTATETDESVRGAFGKGREHFGLTTIHSFTMGNCTLLNLPVAVASDNEGRGIFRRYGSSDGIFGLREMVKYGAILDLGNRLLFVRPNGPSKEIAGAIKSILTAQGYTTVDLGMAKSHLRVSGAINGWPCHFLVDTDAFLTTIDREAANKAQIGGVRTQFVAEAIGGSSREVLAAKFPSLRIGAYEIKNASAAVIRLDTEMLARGTDAETAGLLGAEYLGRNSAVFDFNSGTLYLKPKPSLEWGAR